MKKSTKVLIVVGCIIAFLGLCLLGAIGYFRLSVSSYYSASQKAFVIPGLSDNFVPQGMHYDESQNKFIISGYMSDDTASPIYIVDGENGEVEKKVLLAKNNGKPFTGHAGGVAVWGDYMYVAGGGSRCLYVFSYGELLESEDGGEIGYIGKFDTHTSEEDYVGASFVSVVGDRLFVGEFYDEPKYPTIDSHKMTTKGGAYNQALMIEYELGGEEYGINPTPKCAYSISDCVQGMYVVGEKMYFSTSYGLSFSHIYEHDITKSNYEGEIDLLGHELALYSFDKNSLVEDYKIAPMSEEITFVGGELFVMCESACNKYVFGKFTGGKWCYKTNLEEMKK